MWAVGRQKAAEGGHNWEQKHFRNFTHVSLSEGELYSPSLVLTSCQAATPAVLGPALPDQCQGASCSHRPPHRWNKRLAAQAVLASWKIPGTALQGCSPSGAFQEPDLGAPGEGLPGEVTEQEVRVFSGFALSSRAPGNNSSSDLESYERLLSRSESHHIF